MGLKQFMKTSHKYHFPIWRSYYYCSTGLQRSKECNRRLVDPLYQPPFHPMAMDAMDAFPRVEKLSSADRQERMVAAWFLSKHIEKYSRQYKIDIVTLSRPVRTDEENILKFLKQFGHSEALTILRAPIILRADALQVAKEWRDTGEPPPDVEWAQRQAPELHKQLRQLVAESPLEREQARGKRAKQKGYGYMTVAGIALAATAVLILFSD